MDENTPSKIDLRYTEERVLFLFCDCSLDKKYSFWDLNREQAKDLINSLKHYEKYTWGQLSALPRKTGLTTENPTSESYGMIDEQNTYMEKLAERYYFHFRVDQTGKFRVFGYQYRQFFCITHIDKDGKIHGH
jgi:hypothetical protein